MAGNKIIEKIEEEARQGAAAIEAEAKQKAEAEKSRILGKAKESAAEIEAKAQADAKEAAGRLMLIADLKSRKDSLPLSGPLSRRPLTKQRSACPSFPKKPGKS